MEIREATERLMELQSRLSAYQHAMGIIKYDGVTTGPKGVAANRAHTLAILSADQYALMTGPDTKELLAFLEEHAGELTREQNRMVFLLGKDLKFMDKIPQDEWVAYRRLLTQADDVWHRAKAENDFAAFEPLLKEMFETKVKFAGYAAPGEDPFNFWLNHSEEGTTTELCDRFFDVLRERLVPLIKKIGEKPQVDNSMVRGDFPAEKQRELGLWLMDIFGIDKEHCGLEETEHPFTSTLGSHFDTRMTTNYHRESFTPSMFSVMHEGGHALYGMNCNPDYAYTVLDGGLPLGMHESQSRFMENYVGRSRGFIRFLFPKLQELYPEKLGSCTAEDVYRAVNRVQAGWSRIEADEVTYALHIMVRYELERDVLAGKLAVHDLPAAWNAKYKEYLGVDVQDDTHGVLQDSHWCDGLVGYFPSYSLGSAYGAQFLKKMKETVDFDACVERGDVAPIKAWLKENIWQYGKLYDAQELRTRIFGGPFDPTVFTDYLEAKFTDIYGL